MIQDRDPAEDPAVIARYVETAPGVSSTYLAQLRHELAATPRRRGRRWSVPANLGPMAYPMLVMVVLLIVGGTALLRHNQIRPTTGDAPATVRPGGTILFSRNNHWFTIAPNGTHLHRLLSSTAGCPDFGCGVFSPNGSRIMVAAQAPDKKRIATAIINVDGAGYHLLPLPDRTLNLGPGAWSPNGTRIALGGWDEGHKGRTGIYAVNASNGRGIVRLSTSPDAHNDDPLAYSPDGSRLLFFHEASKSPGTPLFGGLFETTAQGAGRVRLNPPGTQVTATFGSPASWSPDGRQIVFTAFSAPATSGQSAVFVEDANGTHVRRITPWGMWSTSAHWSPDGTWIVFDKIQTVGEGLHSLYLVHPNGTGLKAITSTVSLGGVCCAVWSPDGTKLLFGGPNSTYHLEIMKRDGSGVKYLTTSDRRDEAAEYTWGP